MRKVIVISSGLALGVMFMNCSRHFSPTPGIDVPINQTAEQAIGKNIVTVDVGCSYVNEPCVTVTVCSPNSNNCQQIPNILLDTGSIGLRVFASVVSVPTPAVTDDNGTAIRECYSYGDGTSHWGPLKMADVILGGERASNIPIQFIDSSSGGIPSGCSNPAINPELSQYNGILGVGMFEEDCGGVCTTLTNNTLYYKCTGTSCSSTTMPLDKQMRNPVSKMPLDNNGVILKFPAVPDAGTTALQGTMILGIGTQSNNMPGTVTVYPANDYGNFTTIFNGKTYNGSFIDSGSNIFFFPQTAALPNCTSATASDLYCPPSIVSLSAVQKGATGTTQTTVNFKIMNGEVAFSEANPNYVFNNIGGPTSLDFDWGFPFFLGRSVYTAIEGRKTPLGDGPFWAH